MCMVVLLGAGALGVDVGFTVWGGRQAQSMADTAALDLARYMNLSDGKINTPAVTAYLNGLLANVETDNNTNETLTATPGLWSGGAFTVPSYGCANLNPRPTLEPPCNAVEVTAAQSVPQIFSGGLRTVFGHGLGPNGSSIAAVTPETTFSIGTYLTSYTSQQTAVLNVILGGLGTTAECDCGGLPGAGEHERDDQPADQCFRGSPDTFRCSSTQSLPGADWAVIMPSRTR